MQGNPSIPVGTQVGRLPADSSAEFTTRCAGTWLSGLYAVYALEALRDRAVTAPGWVCIAAVLGLVAAGEAWAARLRWRSRLAAEGGILLGSILLAALVPGWPAPLGQRAQSIVAARILPWLLTLATNLATGPRAPRWADRARVFLLFALTAGSLLVYLTPNVVGPIDARWYGNVITDFVEQFRAGRFPVLSGETLFAFNGAVHPFRSAPWQFDLAALVDLATRGSLAPVAIQHVTCVMSYVAVALVLYAGLARSRPGAEGTAWFLAVFYATSPAVTMSLVMHDMYMTLLAAPVLVATLLAVARAVDEPSFRNYGWVGAGCGILWQCHPPIALLGLLAAAFCIVGNLAIHGLAPRALAAALFGGAVFAFLAAPYFVSTLEISSDTAGNPVEDILMPALGLCILAAALGRTLCRSQFRWLALLPLAWWVLRAYKPTLLPFAFVASGLVAALAIAGLGRPWPALRRHPEGSLLVAAIVAAIAADAWLPRHDLRYATIVSQYVAGCALDPGRFFRPAFDRAYDEPGAAVWLMLAAGLLLLWWARSAFSRLALAAAALLVVALGIIPHASLLLWLNSPDEFISIIGVSYDLRLLPVLAPLVVVACFPLLADLFERRGARRAGLLCACLLLPWSLWEQGLVFHKAATFRNSREASARFYMPENVVLQRYTWDILGTPWYFSNGVMDYRMETRFWPQGPRRLPLIDPDVIAKAMEDPGQAPVAFTATPDPVGPDWLYLAPKIELQPGESKLLRFDFAGRQITGWLILRGETLYREYIMPSSGMPRSFGSQAPGSTVLSLVNSGPRPESIELVVKREGPDRTAPLPPGPFLRAWVSRYDQARAPISVVSLSPLRLHVRAPADGILESFRSYYPGHVVTVDGRPVFSWRSLDGLIDLPVKKGTHDVVIEFKGTAALRAAMRWEAAGWALVGLALCSELVAASRRRASASASPA
jgi:hypothetical protein